ncbi:response regulator [Chryseosolibacter indicus]|uniref:Response regulator transcription factor n=1 Tax=Chryseosolibacter indicus TaxID=2782351 RepID=A0ABS5VYZ7_9BACT|nr:response regulator transcription factor [Chryseosolibacter indicus]MBT1706087.1 response regulator transcription factor [Chryseosolibacter indicus]
MKKVLIVEDDLDIQDVFKIIFSSYGYQVECLDNGKSLCERKGNWPDVIILDKQLPGVNGVEACKMLKANEATSNIPVIMISATSGVDKAAATAGADDYLEKPFNMHVILKKVAGLFKEQKQGLGN